VFSNKAKVIKIDLEDNDITGSGRWVELVEQHGSSSQGYKKMGTVKTEFYSLIHVHLTPPLPGPKPRMRKEEGCAQGQRPCHVKILCYRNLNQ